MMKSKTRGKFVYCANWLLSIAMALIIVVISASLLFVIPTHSNYLLKCSLNAQKSEIIDEVNSKFDRINNDFPVEVYKHSFDEKSADIVIKRIINNINFVYETSFVENAELYNSIKNNMKNYCNDNGISISDKEIFENASLVVDIVNEVFAGDSTANISSINFFSNNLFVYLIVGLVVVIAIFVLIISFLNNGRHRKFNYFGMSISSAGYVLLFSSAFVLVKKYVSNYTFCQNAFISDAVANSTIFMLKLCAILGAIYIVVGLIMLVRNYAYYKYKLIERKEFIERDAKIRMEYLEEYKKKKGNEINDDELTRIVSKIEFNEE